MPLIDEQWNDAATEDSGGTADIIRRPIATGAREDGDALRVRQAAGSASAARALQTVRWLAAW